MKGYKICGPLPFPLSAVRHRNIYDQNSGKVLGLVRGVIVRTTRLIFAEPTVLIPYIDLHGHPDTLVMTIQELGRLDIAELKVDLWQLRKALVSTRRTWRRARADYGSRDRFTQISWEIYEALQADIEKIMLSNGVYTVEAHYSGPTGLDRDVSLSA
jgi:hypothetical protein